ncbi:hypothetical protein BJ912DRAFT_988143 [Pholiota molesta]|nr:hypothetical protein BJ912DRAFT_988143 [Pholiota molesta]
MGPSILVDDSTLVTNYNYLGGQWSLQTGDNSVLNGTLTTGTPGQGTIPSQLFFSFWGSGINFYGNMTSGVAANYTVDGTTRRPIQFPSNVSNGKTGINLFSLNNLTEGLFHDINIYPAAGQFVLDYITYTPNSDTTLSAADLILDDTDSALQYGNGQWNHTTGDFQQGRPYNGTMTGTNTMGATMQLTFVGSSITVNGLLNRVDGRLSASFVVDGQNSSASSFTPFDGNQQNTDSSRWMLSQQFFHQDLAPGEHTLVATLVDVSGPQMLWIDSVVFEGTSSTKSTPASTGSGSGSDLPKHGSTSSSFPKGGIAGIAAGAILLSLLCLAYARSRSRRNLGVFAVSTAPTYAPPPGPPAVASMSQSNGYNTYNPYAPAATQYAPPPASAPLPPPPSSPSQQQYQYREQPPLPAPASFPTPELPGGYDASNYAASSAADTSNTPRADSYYTYSSKADLIGLEWGTRGSGAGVVGDGAADVRMPVPLPARGDGADPARAETGAQVVDADAQGNHAQEDGRDEEGGEAGAVMPETPRRERDAGPADFPPAYDDQLYGR